MHQHRRIRSARRTFAWAAGGLLVCFMITLICGETQHPEWYDRWYPTRRDCLKQSLADHPQSALCLLLGSSRPALAYLPETLPPLYDRQGRSVLPFNFGQYGAGPLMNLMLLDRLLSEGIRPDYLLVELLPSYLHINGERFLMERAGLRDAPVLTEQMNLLQFGYLYTKQRAKSLPSWLAKLGSPLRDPAFDRPVIAELMGGYGGPLLLMDEVTPLERQLRTAAAHRAVGQVLQRYQITPLAEGCTQALIARCREANIPLAFLLMPEAPLFQSWYNVDAQAKLSRFLDQLGDAGLTVYDARNWLDESDTYDSHHTLRRGAEKFTARLGAEVLPDFLHSK